MAGTADGGLLAVHVDVKVKDGCEEAFVEASLHNATNSVQEPGIARFDLIQEADDKKNFTLVEVYSSADAPAAHKGTAHYLKWREEVAAMMAVTRTSVKYTAICPGTREGWAVPDFLSRGERESSSADLVAVHVFVQVKEGCEEAFKKASIENASNSIKEPGVSRFDLLQEADDPTKFVLVEVYSSADAPAAHKGTAHYLKWREEVAAMMAVPRTNKKFVNFFPASLDGWKQEEE